MKLIWHIIRKDIVSERWGLLFWASLYVAQIVFGLVKFRHDEVDRDFMDAIWTANVLMVAAQFFMGYILVVRLVQADDVSGTRMFWLTRPIAPGRLLRAKGWGTTLLFGLGPVLLLLPWWLYCGFTANDIAWAAVETVGWQLLLIVPAFLIASLTEDFGRALMWGLLLLVFLFGGILYLYSARTLSATVGAAGTFGFGGGLLFTRFWLTAFLLIAGSAVVTAHQFQTRRSMRSIGLAVPMMVLALVVGRIWPWDCGVLFTQINDPEPLPYISSDAFAGVQVTMRPAQAFAKEEPTNSWERTHTWVQQVMEIQGVPEELVIGSAQLDQTWLWPGEPVPVGATAHLSFWSDYAWRRAFALPAWEGDPETARWMEAQYADRQARGLRAYPGYMAWKPERPQDHLTMTGRAFLPDSLVGRIRAQTPAGEARVELELAHMQKLLELPLKSGARWSGASRAYRVGPWGERQGHQAGILLAMARPAVRENGLWSADIMDRTFRRPSSRDFSFTAVNRSNNTIGNVIQSGDTSKSGRVVIGGVALQWTTLNVYSVRVIRNGKWVAYDPDWPEHTSLVRLIPDRMVRVIRELKTEKFELEPSAPIKPTSDKSF